MHGDETEIWQEESMGECGRVWQGRESEVGYIIYINRSVPVLILSLES